MYQRFRKERGKMKIKKMSKRTKEEIRVGEINYDKGMNDTLQEIKEFIQDNEKDSWIECGKLLNKIEELKVQEK